MCLIKRQVAAEAERAEVAVSIEGLLARMLGELFEK